MIITPKNKDNPPSPGIPGNPAGKFPVGAESSPLMSTGLLDRPLKNALTNIRTNNNVSQYSRIIRMICLINPPLIFLLGFPSSLEDPLQSACAVSLSLSLSLCLGWVCGGWLFRHPISCIFFGFVSGRWSNQRSTTASFSVSMVSRFAPLPFISSKQ